MIIELKDQIRFARTQKGLTTTALAAAIGVSEQSIKNYEKGIRVPKKSHLQKLEDVLETSLSVTGSAITCSSNGMLDGISADVVDLAKSIMDMPLEIRNAIFTLVTNVPWYKSVAHVDTDVQPFFDRENAAVQPHYLTTIHGSESADDEPDFSEISAKNKSASR
jgi:transcriptional regulator with XRE-family HTH domain